MNKMSFLFFLHDNFFKSQDIASCFPLYPVLSYSSLIPKHKIDIDLTLRTKANSQFYYLLPFLLIFYLIFSVFDSGSSFYIFSGQLLSP